MSDLAMRYLVPSFDCGVNLEGAKGQVSAQIIQVVRFLPADSCALCRDMIMPARLAQELMSPEERLRRQAAAEEARTRGEPPAGYWHSEPQLNTVGYLTTVAGALVAGYAIGLLTRRFDAPFSRIQLDLNAEWLGVVDADTAPRPHCACGRVRGWNDQGLADALINAPAHWPRPEFLSDDEETRDVGLAEIP